MDCWSHDKGNGIGVPDYNLIIPRRHIRNYEANRKMPTRTDINQGDLLAVKCNPDALEGVKIAPTHS